MNSILRVVSKLIFILEGSVVEASSATVGNYLHLSANNVDVAIGESVVDWADASGTGKEFGVLAGCGTPFLAQAS